MLSKGEQGNSKFVVNANETSLQDGVTRVAAESFTDPAGWICHLYDSTPLERETRRLSLLHVRSIQ